MKKCIWILVVALATSSLAKKEDKPDDRGKRGVFGEQVLLQPSSGLQNGLQDTRVEQPGVADLYSSEQPAVLQSSPLRQPDQLVLQNSGWNQQVALPASIQPTSLNLQSSLPNLQEARLNFNAYPLSFKSAPSGVLPSLNYQYESQSLQAPITTDLYPTSNFQSLNFVQPSIQLNSQLTPLNLGPISYANSVPVSHQVSPLSVNNAALNIQANQGATLHSQYAPFNSQYTPVNLQYANDNSQYAPLNYQYTPLNNNAPLNIEANQGATLYSQYAPFNSQYTPVNLQYANDNSQYAPLSYQYTPLNNNAPLNIQANQGAALNSQYAPFNSQYTPVNLQYANDNSQYAPLNYQYTPLNNNAPLNIQANQGATLHSQYAPLNSQYTPVNLQYANDNLQYAPLNNQYIPINTQYAPLNSQYSPVNTHNSQINSQYTPLSRNQVTANLQESSLNLQPVPLSLQAPVNLQQQNAPSNVLKSSLTFGAPSNLNQDLNIETPTVKSAPLNLNDYPLANNQSPITLLVVPLAQPNDLNYRPQTLPIPNQALLTPPSSYGPSQRQSIPLAQTGVELPQGIPSYPIGLQKAGPIQSYGAASAGQEYATSYQTPLIRAGIDNIQKFSKVHKVVKVPVTVNIGYVSRVTSDQKYVKVQPSIEIPVQNPVSVEATRQAGTW